MFKNFEKVFRIKIALSSFLILSPLHSANFSVSNNLADGPDSLTSVLKSSNAIFPGEQGKNVIYFRDNLTFNDPLVANRQNVIFDISNHLQVAFNTPFKSSAELEKKGGGSLSINQPMSLAVPLVVSEGRVNLLCPKASSAGFKNFSKIYSPSGSYFGNTDVYLFKSSTLEIQGGGVVNGKFHAVEPSMLILGPGDFTIQHLFGQSSLQKLGSGNVKFTHLSEFTGELILSEGLVEINEAQFHGTLTVDEGRLVVKTPLIDQSYHLNLKNGLVEINTQDLKFTKGINLVGSSGKILLNNHTVSLDQGLKGWGSVDVFGPGSINVNQVEGACGFFNFHDLSLNTQAFAPRSEYSFDKVNLGLVGPITLDSSTSWKILEGRTLVDFHDHPVNLMGKITGNGTLAFSGSNTLEFHSPENYNGHVQMLRGHLNFHSNIHSLHVEQSASVSGAGVLNDLVIEGTFFPKINAENDADHIAVSNASISGPVILMAEKGDYDLKDYLLIESKNVHAKTEILTPAQFEGYSFQDHEGLKFKLTKFHKVSDYTDQEALDHMVLATSLDEFMAPYDSEIDHVMRELLAIREDTVEFNTALDSLQPAYFSALGLVQESNFILARSSLSNRMQELITFPCAKKYVWDEDFTLWLDPVGDFTQQNPRQHDMGYHAATVGAFAGFDFRLFDRFRLGFSSGYTNSRVNWMEDVGKGIINSVYLSSYFLYKPNNFYLNMSIDGAYSHYNTDRYIKINSFKSVARHKNHGFGYEADFELGYLFQGKLWTTQPYLRQTYVGLFQQKFTETGASSLNLNVDSKTFAMYRAEGGLVFNRCLNYTKWSLTPEITLAAIWEQEVKTGTFHARYEESEIQYDVVGMKPKRLMFSPGLALDAVIKKYPLMLGVRYHAELCPQYYDQRIAGHIAYSF